MPKSIEREPELPRLRQRYAARGKEGKMLEQMDAEHAAHAAFGVPPSGGGARLSSAATVTNAERAAGGDSRAPAAPASDKEFRRMIRIKG